MPSSRNIDPITGLDERQELFCRHYICMPSGADAARRAGYSWETAGVQASQLLKRLNIAMRIHDLKEERDRRLEANADDVHREIAKIAMSNMDDFVKPSKGKNFELKEHHELTRDQMACIKELDFDEKVIRSRNQEDTANEPEFDDNGDEIENVLLSRKVKLKLYDKLAALDKLARKHKFYSDDAAPPQSLVGNEDIVNALKGTIEDDWTGDEL